jgi:hypothetical protein
MQPNPQKKRDDEDGDDDDDDGPRILTIKKELR